MKIENEAGKMATERDALRKACSGATAWVESKLIDQARLQTDWQSILRELKAALELGNPPAPAPDCEPARTSLTDETVSMSQRIAWATKSFGNGKIYQWSRWHIARSLMRGESTLCGLRIPNTKWITPQPGDESGDYRIRGGECRACKVAAMIPENKDCVSSTNLLR